MGVSLFVVGGGGGGPAALRLEEGMGGRERMGEQIRIEYLPRCSYSVETEARVERTRRTHVTGVCPSAALWVRATLA